MRIWSASSRTSKAERSCDDWPMVAARTNKTASIAGSHRRFTARQTWRRMQATSTTGPGPPASRRDDPVGQLRQYSAEVVVIQRDNPVRSGLQCRLEDEPVVRGAA